MIKLWSLSKQNRTIPKLSRMNPRLHVICHVFALPTQVAQNQLSTSINQLCCKTIGNY